MSSCNPCDPAGCGGIPTGAIMLKKLRSMIADNYTLLFIFAVLMIILGLALVYFAQSLVKTLSGYYKSKGDVKMTSGNDPRTSIDDNYDYYDPISEDPEKIDVEGSMPKSVSDFSKQIDQTYNEYNTLKSEYIKTTYARKNDDIVDIRLRYSNGDDYDYTVPQ